MEGGRLLLLLMGETKKLIDRDGTLGLVPVSSRQDLIYLDHHATTPVDPRVVDVLICALTGTFGNAQSVDHVFGEAAADLALRSRAGVATLIGAAPENIRFTSGSTEGIRLAFAHARELRRGRSFRIALPRVEHKAVLDAVEDAVRSSAADVIWLEVDQRARLDRNSVMNALHAGVDLICLMAANNEVGTIYPIQEIAAAAHANGAAILVDATQAAGRVPLHAAAWELDYLVISSHKVYGPKGVGALVSSANPDTWHNILWARGGTPNVPGIAAFGEACRIAALDRVEEGRRISSLRDRLQVSLCEALPELSVNGDLDNRLDHNLHISIPDIPNDALVARLRNKVAISTGAACASGTHAPSHVLEAMRLPASLQEGALRIGLGRFTTLEDVERAASEIVQAAQFVRKAMVRA